jgi:ribosomal protein S18 acetylase RimI-like enzyme
MFNMFKVIKDLIKSPEYSIVYQLEKNNMKPINNTHGLISVEPITHKNIDDVVTNFPQEKIPVFHEKLMKGCVGVFAKYESNVVGYQWRKDYDTDKTVKADGYIPLKGRFSHLHFARVINEMRGQGILSQMMTYLIENAFEMGIVAIYTDCERDNLASNRGVLKFGFHEIFRLLVINAFGRILSIKYH